MEKENIVKKGGGEMKEKNGKVGKRKNRQKYE